MARMGRPGLSDQEKSELWRLWQAGQSLSDIGMALGKHAGSKADRSTAIAKSLMICVTWASPVVNNEFIG